MIQDLRPVNSSVLTRAPVVPDPHKLLNQLEADKCVFTVIHLSNAFFSIPVHKDSQYWFAFTHEGNRYTYTRLPQGYAESPAIVSAEIQKVVSTAVLRHDSQIITYVDDILIASTSQLACDEDTRSLLLHLHAHGCKVKREKLHPNQITRSSCYHSWGCVTIFFF